MHHSFRAIPLSLLFTVLTLVSVFLPTPSYAQDLVLKKGDRVAIVGDSITEQKQYSKFMELYLLACVPELDLTMYQFGWSGERAPGFANRMENDFVGWKPTVVTTCFGMNDGSYRPYTDNIGKAYEDGTRRIQARCKTLGARMIVGGPGPVDTDAWRANDPNADEYYNKNLATLSGIAGKLAKENGFVYAALHPLMMKSMADAKAKLGKEYHVCGRDGVHPAANGHLVMAYAYLKAMGLDGNIATITIDLNGKSTVTEGHKVLSSEGDKVTIESTRYPFCFTGKENDPNGTVSILPYLPFNKDLNRFKLVVKNIIEPEVKVTWGKETKTFKKEELEAGINLAAEFLNNPFSEPFAKLERVVAEKQQRETRTIKGTITQFRGILNDFPEDKEVIDATNVLRSKLFERNAQDAAKARAAVVPVQHTIQISTK
jgi:lysophospholipase L1-like esterase